MRRFIAATFGWRAGAVASALLAAVALAGPAAAANTNLTATAKYSSSSDWQSAQNNPAFVAAKAFDGDYTTRWNSDSGDQNGAWLAANWDNPVTINKVVIYEAIPRVNGFRVQRRAAGSTDWVDAYVGEGDGYTAVKGGDASKPVYKIRLSPPIQTAGLRVLFTDVSNVPTIFEVEAYNNPAGTLTGTVADPAGKPIPGVTISGGGDSATSDANGKYTLITDAGKYNVTASKFGLFRDRIARALVLPANGAAAHDFVLLPLPPNLSLTATAVASSEDSGGSNAAALANDGKPDTRWLADSGETDGATLDMQWAQPQTFDKVTIREAGDQIRNYSLQTYDDASAKFIDIPGASNIAVAKSTANPILTNAFATPLTSKRVRLLVIHADASPSVWEMQVSNAPLGTASVVVTDVATGKPVPNATITSDLGAILGTTDANGAVNLLLDADDYVVTASATGYFAGAPAAFTINGGDKQQITLTTPAQGPDIALKATASASSEDAAYPAANVNDGDPATYWLATDYANQWVAVTWKQPTHFTVVQLRGFQGVIGRSFLQMLDKDGKTWVDLPNTVIAPELSNTPADFLFPDGITTTAVRYFITATNSTTNIPGVSEFYVYDSPIPKPAP